MSQEPPREPSEEELRAAYEAELERVSVDDVVLQSLVSFINLGAYRIEPPQGRPPDLEQARVAVDAARALLPVVEARHPDRAGPIRDGLSQLQLAYARKAGAPPAGAAGEGAPPQPEAPGAPPRPGGEAAPPGAPPPPRSGEAGPAQRSGRLWVPGQ